jgi:hypothetical protein
MIYRLRQGIGTLFAFTQVADTQLAARYLAPPLLTLFQTMRHSEQLHALNVLRMVLAQMPDTPPNLAIAALLHDVGKARYRLHLWQKTLPVLVKALNPALLERLSNGNPDNLLIRPFASYVHHPAWGAELVAERGASETVVWLVARHQDDIARWHDHDCLHLLKRLQTADDTN